MIHEDTRSPTPERDDPDARLARILAEDGIALETPAADTPAPATAARPDPLLDPLAAAREPEENRATAHDDDARTLPDAPLFALLASVAEAVGPERVDRVWLFPPRRFHAGETSVLVVAAFTHPASDRRHVFAAHYTAPAESREPRLHLDELGVAPAERLGRLVEDAVERLEDDPPAPPRTVRIDGDTARWHAMVHELAEQHLEQALGSDRRRR